MKKRFTDSDIWDDPWFRKLPCVYKEFWRFICDKCDASGVWKVDTDSAAFFIGHEVDPVKAVEFFNTGKDRVKILDPDRWFITGFIFFQYGDLSPACRPHAHVLAMFSKHRIKGFVKGIHTLKEKDKDKEQDKEQDIGGLREDKDLKSNTDFLAFWKAYPRKTGKDAALKAWEKKTPPLDACLAALAWQKNQDQWQRDGGRYIPHASTWLNGGRWSDERMVSAAGNGSAPVPGKYDGIGEKA